MVELVKSLREASEGEQNITSLRFMALGFRSTNYFNMKKLYTEIFEPCEQPNLFAITVQPPTFKTISEAYSYFTRHADQFPPSDFESDGEDIPDMVDTSDILDTLDNFYAKSLDSSHRNLEPIGFNQDGQRAPEDAERGTREDDDGSSSTSD